MSFMGIVLLIALFAALAARQERDELFPDQTCIHCHTDIHYDFKHSRWLHDNGKQYMPTPNRMFPDQHPALPPVRPW